MRVKNLRYRLDGEDDAIEVDDPYSSALADGISVGRDCFPVIAVNSNTAMAACFNGHAHNSLSSYQCVGIAGTLWVVAVEVL